MRGSQFTNGLVASTSLLIVACGGSGPVHLKLVGIERSTVQAGNTDRYETVVEYKDELVSKVSEKRQNGTTDNETTYSYKDGRLVGRVRSEPENPDRRTDVTITYDEEDRVWRIDIVETYNPQNSDTERREFTWDGDLLRQETRLDDQQLATTTFFTYDDDGRLKERAIRGWNRTIDTFTRNGDDQLTRVDSAETHDDQGTDVTTTTVNTYTYDGEGRLNGAAVEGVGVTWALTYDGEGRVQTITETDAANDRIVTRTMTYGEGEAEGELFSPEGIPGEENFDLEGQPLRKLPWFNNR